MRLTLIILILIIIEGCDQTTSIVQSYRTKFVGNYKINLSKSKIYPYDRNVAAYEKLKFHLDADGRFDFNFQVPFIYSKAGKWIMAGDGESVYAVIEYTDKLTDQVPMDTTGAVYINMPIPQDNNKQIELLYLDKY